MKCLSPLPLQVFCLPLPCRSVPIYQNQGTPSRRVTPRAPGYPQRRPLSSPMRSLALRIPPLIQAGAAATTACSLQLYATSSRPAAARSIEPLGDDDGGHRNEGVNLDAGVARLQP